jgi:hypothetical protein
VHSLLVPRHGARQHIEELVGRGDETRPEVNPGTVGKRLALNRIAELRDAEFAEGAEQRRLDDERHTTESSPDHEHTFVARLVPKQKPQVCSAPYR